MKVAAHHAKEADRQLTVAALDLNSPLYVDLYDGVVKLVQAALQVPICLFSIIDHDRQFFKACVGLSGRETARDFAFCAHAIIQDDLQQIFCVEDATTHPDFADNPLVTGAPHVRFYAGLAVRAPNGVPVGTLCIIDTTPRPLSALMSQVLQLGRGLLESQLQMFYDAVRDPLTGLRNRRFMQEALDREWRRAYRQLLPLTVLLIDVDYFKPYNDRYGHPKGDAALKAIANELSRSCKRPSDLVCRYGGEEFFALLPETNREGAELVGQKLLKAVRDAQIIHADSPTGALTVSIGAAVIDSREGLECGYELVVGKADSALYAAKSAGRNCLRFAPSAADKKT